MRTTTTVLAALVAVTAITGCAPAAASPSPSASPSRLSGDVIVFAAASLTEALGDDRARLLSDHPGLTLSLSFAGSQQLVAQVRAGAPADVVVTADQASMQGLVDGNLVEPPRVFARNKLEIVVAPGNPRAVRGLADLARPDLRVVLADPSVPVGKYGRQALAMLGVTVKPVSLALDVKSEVRVVESGDADAAIVYVTDVKAAATAVSGVEIPDAQNVGAIYPVAVVRASHNRDAAEAYLEQLLSGPGRDALQSRGFLSP